MAQMNILELGLISIARTGEVEDVMTSAYGTKYVIGGTLTSPDGDLLQIRTV